MDRLRVSLSLPEGWHVQAKPSPWHWDSDFTAQEAEVSLGAVRHGERTNASFWVLAPDSGQVEKVSYIKHPFDIYEDLEKEPALEIVYKNKPAQSGITLTARLTARKPEDRR